MTVCLFPFFDFLVMVTVGQQGDSAKGCCADTR